MKFDDPLIQETKPTIPHYYGDTVRNLFLVAAAILMASAALDEALFAFYLFLGIFVLLALVILAGLTSPLKRFSILADAILSGALLIFFEYSALIGHTSIAHNGVDVAFMLRQILALIFLVALYFSIKTLRGMTR